MGTAESGDYTIADLENTEVVIDGDATAPANMTSAVTVTFSIDPMQDGDTDDETVQITAMAGGESGMADLTITDDGESAGTITITTSLDELRENVRARDVVVTATLSETSTDPVTVMVTAEVDGESDMPTDPVTVSITIPAGDTEGSVTVSLDPTNDDTFTTRNIVVTGSAPDAGYVSGSAMIKVLDDDTAIGELTITAASPPSVTTGTATDVTLTVKGLIFDKEEDSGTVTATLTTTAGTFPNGTATDELTITMNDHVDLVPDEDSPDGTAKIVLSLSAADAATAGTRITVTASADMYDAGSRVITVVDRGGLDIQGYRAVLAKPAAEMAGRS